MGFSNMMMAAAKSIPKSTMSQSMPSRTYSSCSTTNMWWLKNCWSFSFTKLMEICSKPLYSNISKPAISSTAQKLAFFNEALEDSIKNSSSNTTNCISCLFTGLTFDDPLSSYFNSWLTESFDHSKRINTKNSSSLSRVSVWSNGLTFSLIITTLSFELNSSTCHDTSSEHVAVKFFLLRKSKHVKGIFSVFQLFIVIN